MYLWHDPNARRLNFRLQAFLLIALQSTPLVARVRRKSARRTTRTHRDQGDLIGDHRLPQAAWADVVCARANPEASVDGCWGKPKYVKTLKTGDLNEANKLKHAHVAAFKKGKFKR